MDDAFCLHKAAAAGDREECKRLIISGKDLNEEDHLGWTPLMHAVCNQHFLIARDFLSLGALVCTLNHYGVTVFTLAGLGCDDDLLTTLYEHLEPPDLQREESNTALQVASLRGIYPVAKWLLNNTDVDVNLVSPLTGVAALHLAVIGQHVQLVELLLGFGADATICTALGLDVSELATACGGKNILQLLYKDMTPTQDICFDFKKVDSKQDRIDSQYTANNIYLDLQENMVLKNSPCHPVFKTSRGDEFDAKRQQKIKLLMSPSLKSVFSPSPKSNNKAVNRFGVCELKPEYNLHALVSPRVHQKSPVKSPNRGNKRKLINISGCSSWLKRLTKRRTRSINDLDSLDTCDVSLNFDPLKPNGIDFSNLLFNLGLDDFFTVFREQELDIWTFLTLTKEDLDAMGLTDPDTQALILERIQMFKKTQI